MKKRKPWNRVSEQVYSLSTLDLNGNVNMNIATYVVPVTMDTKRYSLAIYKGTKTHENIFAQRKQKYCILQALSKSQAPLVKVLGKKSGLRYNKQKYLEKNNLLKIFEFENKNFFYLKENSFSLFLKIEKYVEIGDHDMVICAVQNIVENNFEKEMLNTLDLQDSKIIG